MKNSSEKTNQEFNFIKLTLFYRKEIKRQFENGDNCGYLSPSVLITFMDILVGLVNRTYDKLMTFSVEREDVLDELNFLTGEKVTARQYDSICEKLQKWGILSFKKGKNKMVKRAFSLNLHIKNEGKKVPKQAGNDNFLPDLEHNCTSTAHQESKQDTPTETIYIKGLKEESVKEKKVLKNTPSSSSLPEQKILEEGEVLKSEVNLESQLDSETEMMIKTILDFFKSVKGDDKTWLTHQISIIKQAGHLEEFKKRTRSYLRLHREFKELNKFKTSMRKYVSDLWSSKDWTEHYGNLVKAREEANKGKVHQS